MQRGPAAPSPAGRGARRRLRDSPGRGLRDHPPTALPGQDALLLPPPPLFPAAPPGAPLPYHRRARAPRRTARLPGRGSSSWRRRGRTGRSPVRCGAVHGGGGGKGVRAVRPRGCGAACPGALPPPRRSAAAGSARPPLRPAGGRGAARVRAPGGAVPARPEESWVRPAGLQLCPPLPSPHQVGGGSARRRPPPTPGTRAPSVHLSASGRASLPRSGQGDVFINQSDAFFSLSLGS